MIATEYYREFFALIAHVLVVDYPDLMKIYDVTVAISNDMPIYKGDPNAAVESFKAIARGDSANVSSIRFGVHSGTHVDAPNHFIDGTKHVHEIDLHKLIGPCRVVEVGSNVMEIEPNILVIFQALIVSFSKRET